MTVSQATPHPYHIAPENISRGGERFVPGQHIPGNGGNEFVDGAETAGAFDGVADISFLGKENLNFTDLLDVINPLQHLPVIGDLYRSVTSDQISAPARMAGGTIYGGPIGFVSSLINTIMEEATGDDIGGHMLALFKGDGSADETVQTAVASNKQTTPTLATLEPAPVAAPATTSTKATAEAVPAAAEKLASIDPGPANNGGIAPTGPLLRGHDTNAPSEQPPLAPTPFAAKGTTAQLSNTEAASRGIPELSPAAFQALMSSVNGNSKPRFASRQGLTAGSELPPVSKGTIRDAGLEINRLLRPHSRDEP